MCLGPIKLTTLSDRHETKLAVIISASLKTTFDVALVRRLPKIKLPNSVPGLVRDWGAFVLLSGTGTR